MSSLPSERLAGDGHRLLLAGGPVLGGHVHDAVGVDVEGDLDLGHAAGAGGRSTSWNLPSVLLYMAISRSPCSTWISTDGWPSSAVVKTSRPLRRDGRVALDQLGHDPALGLDAERQRGDVEEQDVLYLALQHAGLDRGADRDHLVGVDALVGLVAGHGLDQVLYRRHPGGATYQHHMVDLRLGEAGVVDRLLEGTAAGLHEVRGQLLELGAGQLQVEMLGAASVAVMKGRLIVVSCTDESSIFAFSAASLAAGAPSCRQGRRPRCP